MADSQVEEIKSKLNIVDVISDYVQLKKAGVNFRARCPFHQEKSPSFYVSPSRQIWHCFGCSLGGDVFEFVKQIESVDFREALERLAQKAGVELRRREFIPSEAPDRKKILYHLNDLAARFYHKVLTGSGSAQEARDYLAKRKFTQATVTAWNLGYAPEGWDTLYQFLKKKGYEDRDIADSGLAVHRDEGGYFDRFRDRITFPIIDMLGRTVGFSARLLHPKDNAGKYINSPESPIYNKSEVLFGLYQARTEIRRQNLAVVVEGNADVIKSHQAGTQNVVASSGTALTSQHLSKLQRLCDQLTFAFDADAAGLTAARRALDSALIAGFRVRLIAPIAGLKDPDEIIDRDPGLWKKLIGEAADFLDFYFHKLFGILNLRDPHAKKQATAEFLSLLGKVADPIIQSHYVGKIAEAISVKEQLVADLFRQSLPKKDPRFAAGGNIRKTGNLARPPDRRASPQEPLEKRFIGLLFRQPEQLPHFLSVHEISHFLDPRYQAIFEQARLDSGQKLIEPKPAAIASDANSLEAKPVALKVGKFMADHPQQRSDLELAMFSTEMEFEKPEQMLAELGEVSRRLRKNHLDREKARLGLAIMAAEKNRDIETRNRLAAELNNLILKERE